MIYIASPFSSSDESEERVRYHMAHEYTANLIKQKFVAFSPIVYCYHMHLNYDLPGDAAYWEQFNIQMMNKAFTMHVLTLDGWKESKGVQAEIEWWKQYKPHREIHFIEL